MLPSLSHIVSPFTINTTFPPFTGLLFESTTLAVIVIVSLYLPVGVLTVVNLMNNIIKTYENQHGGK